MLPAGNIAGAQSSSSEDGRNYRPKHVFGFYIIVTTTNILVPQNEEMRLMSE